jgi:hypothetical protein
LTITSSRLLLDRLFLKRIAALDHNQVRWKLSGLIHSILPDFYTDGWPLDPGIPVATDIPIASNLMPGFGPMEMTGPIRAFDGTVQVGAWDMQVSQAPELATLALVGLGLARLAAARRRKQ